MIKRIKQITKQTKRSKCFYKQFDLFLFAQHGRTLTSESLECAFVVGNT